MQTLQVGTEAGASVAVIPEPAPVRPEVIFLRRIRRPLVDLLPIEPITAHTFQSLAGFNHTDRRIQPESFETETRIRYEDLRNVSKIRLPAGIPTGEVDQYLASEGKEAGNEFHLFAFTIANPTHRLPPAVAWKCKWVTIEGEQKRKIFVPQHLWEDTTLPVFVPCLSGTLESRDLRAHTITPTWNPTVEIIVTDLKK